MYLDLYEQLSDQILELLIQFSNYYLFRVEKSFSGKNINNNEN